MFKNSLFLLVLLLIGSCKFKPNVQEKGSGFLQGIWQESSNPADVQLMTLEKKRFTFTCDSFYLVIKTTSKVDLFGDSCYNNGNWQEYVKGTYIVQKDTIRLKGSFVSAAYRLKTSACYRNGNYEETFLINKKWPLKAVFLKIPGNQTINLNLEKKLICKPKVIR